MDIAIRLKNPGGPDQLETVEWPAKTPGHGEIRLRHEAIGVNFIDIYHRTGLYPLPEPAIPGVEGVGIVEAVGEGVDGLRIGQRVAYAGIAGGYAATRVLPEWRAVPVPDGLDPHIVAACFIRGLTAHMLLTRTFAATAGKTVLIHAAAGGLGIILTRWAKQLGLRVIGTVGSPEKARIAAAHGADQVIIGRDADYAAEIARLTDGTGVDFAIDGIGGAVLAKTLACVRRFGTVASIGEAGGPIPPIAVEAIGPVRSLNFARPSVMAYTTDPQTYREAAGTVLAMIAAGVHATLAARYPLAEAASAHRELESGGLAGAIVLLP